jgi:hypothetical protein
MGRLERLAVRGAVVVLVAAVAGCGGSVSRRASATGSESLPSPAPGTAASCNLPLTHDTIDGFHIAIPESWDLSTLRGELQVAKDVSANEAVLVSPAVQTGGLTPASYFQSQWQSLEGLFAGVGRTATITGGGSGGRVPSATFTASGNGEAIKGEATVVVRSLRTPLSSSELDFVASWAPQSSFPAESSRLSAIAGCYGSEAGSLYQVYRDQAFTYMLPPGWTVPDGGETQDSIDLHSSTADVGYLNAAGTEFSSPQSLIDVYLSTVGANSVRGLWTSAGPSQQLPGGGVQQTEYEEFTAAFHGTAAHGLIFALTDSGASTFSTGVVRVAISTAATWNALNGGMIQMAGAIQHDFTQDLQELERLNRQWQYFSNQEQNFDDVLNNQQLVQDPTTGTYYEAPYAAYDPNGPEGPGYYRNGVKLTEAERPAAPAVVTAHQAPAGRHPLSLPRLAFP